MQTRSLRTLVKISQAGSFAQAAGQLGITLSTLSMQMKALETELGVALFDRNHRPPRLTPLAVSVVEQATAMLRHEDQLVELCRPSDTLVGHFKLGFVTTAAVRLLPEFLKRAQTLSPQARFEVETGLSAVLQEKVLNGQIDAAVLTDAGAFPPRLLSHLLRREPFVFAAHQRLLDGGLAGLMAQHRFFHFMPGTGIGKLIAQAMGKQKRSPNAASIVLDDLEAIMECVTEGLGFTLLPKPDVTRYLTPEVRTIAAPDDLERKLVLTVQREGALAPRLGALQALFGAD